MNFLQVLLLSFIQGFTEFLPISSSGHLSLFEILWQIKNPLFLTVILHFGSLLAIALFFFNDIKKILFKNRELIIKILIATFPLIPAVFALQKLENYFSNLKIVTVGFFITGLFLLMTKFIKNPRKNLFSLTYLDAFFIGLAQLLAILPGFSRSGLTISTGLFLKNNPQDSFKFSFLLSLPAILGSSILEMRKIFLLKEISFPFPLILFGLCFSFLFSYFSLLILKKILIQNKLFYFSFYLFSLSLIILFVIL